MKNAGLYFFFFFLLGDLLGIFLENRDLQYGFKPLIVPALIFHLAIQPGFASNKLLRWVMIALIFSWIGDVLLMFDDRDGMFFILGLSSFLLAHVFYIIFFFRLKVFARVRINPIILVLVFAYYAILIYFLSPYLGEMKLPVCIYGIVISSMLMLALHMRLIQNKSAGGLMMTGAILFVISDSFLAFNKFYEVIPGAGLIIMSTYGFAQLLIVLGSVSMAGINKVEGK